MLANISTEALDELDLMLIKEMELDGRITYLELAKKVGTSDTTVRRRITSLLNSGTIHLSVMINSAHVGIPIYLAVKARPGEVDIMIKHLNSFQNVLHIVLTSGRYDAIIAANFKDIEELHQFITNEIGIKLKVTSVESMLPLSVVKRALPRLGDDPPNETNIFPNKNSKYIFDEFDLSLIRELEISPRESSTKLAKTLGANRFSVSRRLQKLKDMGLLRVFCHTDPGKLGYSFQVVILIRVDPSQTPSVANALAGYKQIRYVSIITGRFDIIVWAWFQSSQDMTDFMQRQLSSIPGVLSLETLIGVGIFKFFGSDKVTGFGQFGSFE
ncbi:MAG: Lrp/AsnC family transcriptional regulator [Desulfobacterium sp.]|nr:Lrp/AsnC family transcriptional regulator [Desulfobacterium sp.]MBU3947745.1 Lrp/AsnC family transcriptional regulator [Pseudomonadota bacterium]